MPLRICPLPKLRPKVFTPRLRPGMQGIRNCIIAEGDQQEQLASTMVDLIISGKKLGDAAKDKFGAGAGKLAADTVNKEDAARIDGAQETDSGDDAKLQLNPNSKALVFHKTDGGWKMQILDYAGGNTNSIADQICAAGRTLRGDERHHRRHHRRQISHQPRC